LFDPSSPLLGPTHLQSTPQAESGTTSYIQVARTAISYLNQVKPWAQITPNSWLQEDLDLSDAEIGQTVYNLLYLTGHEYEPGLFNRPLRTVEDLILYITSSPELDVSLLPSNPAVSIEPAKDTPARFNAA